uniref:Ciliary neurotrophic factor n=1 Tax=Xiphophorus couchianus TaxID=32473 RepID=A0A3B5KTL1_9TELE
YTCMYCMCLKGAVVSRQVVPRKQENLPEDMESDRLVFVSHPSSQLDTKSKLLSLHTGLDKCYSLLERAIALEEEELDGVETTEYKNTRGRLKGELLNLLKSTEGLLKAAGETETDNLFHLKLWVYSVLMEVKFWSSTAIALLRELQAVAAKEPSKKSKRSTRSTRH